MVNNEDGGIPLTIVIPVYNEKDNIKITLAEIASKVKTPHIVKIVYDFEEDNTLPVLREIMVEHKNIELKKNSYGQGALNAIKTGLKSNYSDAVLVMMADLSDDIERIDEMYNKFTDGFDLICGSRYMKGGRQDGGPLVKKTLSRVAGLMLYHFAGLPTRDATNSFKMYRKAIFDDIKIESSGGFELGMEITIKAHKLGYRIAEIPSIWRDREAGKSNFKLWVWMPNYLHWFFYAFKK